MQQSNLLSAFRSIITLFGSYVIGHAIFGVAVTTTTWDIIGGSAATLFGTIWGIADKTATIEGVQSAVRSIIISLGGIMVAAGKVSQNTLNEVLGLITSLAPILQSYLSKVKVNQIATGVLKPSTTGKVSTSIPPAK